MDEKIIEEFQNAVRIDYGRDIGFEEATVILNDIVGYFSTLGKIESRIKPGELV